MRFWVVFWGSSLDWGVVFQALGISMALAQSYVAATVEEISTCLGQPTQLLACAKVLAKH